LSTLQEFLLVAPLLLLSMVAHEYAHGWVALRHGDPTAHQLGRLTWNPAKHIDPFLTVILPALMWFMTSGALIFGGAKPVPVNPRNYRNYKRGDIAVSLAGVVTNLILAALLAVLIIVMGLIGRSAPGFAESASLVQRMLALGVWINIILAGFNLLPIPPLDGSHVAKYLLPPAWALQYERLGRYGLLLLIVLLTVGRGIIMPYFMFLRTLYAGTMRTIAPFIIPTAWTL
jgi:Zn-dependent protease